MLAPDQIKTLLQNCTEPMLTVALHLSFAGSLRKGEILALTWDDIDFDNGTVSVSKTLKRVRRDAVKVLNEKDILYQFPAVFDEGRTVTVLKRPKTRSSVRTVYLPTFEMETLSDWKSKQTPCGKGKLDLVLRYGNGRPIQEETLPRMLEKVVGSGATQGDFSQPAAQQHFLQTDSDRRQHQGSPGGFRSCPGGDDYGALWSCYR